MQNCSRCLDRISQNFYCLDVFWMTFLAGTFSDDFPIFVQWKNGCAWLPERVLALFSFGMVEFFFSRRKDGLPVHLSCIPKVLSCFYFLDKLESWSVSQGFNQSLERVDFPTGLETLELSSAFQVLPAKCNWAANAKVFKGNPWQVFADPSLVGNTASILDWRLFELNVECTFLFRSDSKDALVTLNPSFARNPPRVLAKFYQSISQSWCWCTLLRNSSAESHHGGVYPFNQPGLKVNPPKIFGAYQGLIMTHPFSGWSPFGVESQWYPLLFPEVRRCPAFVSATFDVQTWWWDARSNFAAFEREKFARAWVKVNPLCWSLLDPWWF